MAVEVFKLFGSIFVNNDEANNSIAKTDEKAKSVASTLGKGIGTAAKWGGAVVAGATAAVGGLVSVAEKSAGVADNVDKMSQKIGISREAYQELDFICSQSGTSVDSLQAGMKTLTSAMDGAANGTASKIELFDKLGISATDTNGKLRNSEDVMWETFNALQGMENQTEKARIATQLFGKSGTELMPLLNGSAGSIEEMKKQAHDLGLVMSDETIDAGVGLTDVMDQLKRGLGAAGNKIGSSLMPLVKNFCKALIDNMPKIQKFISDLVPFINKFFDSLAPPLLDLAEQLLPIIMNLLTLLMPVIGDLFSNLAPIITQFIQMLIPPLITIIQNLLPPLLSVITSLLPLVVTIFNLLSPFIELIVALIEPFTNLITSALVPIINQLAILLNDFLQPLIPVFNEIADVLLQSLTPVFEALAPVFSTIFDVLSPVIELLLQLLNKLIPHLIPIIEDLAKVLSTVLAEGFKCIAELISRLPDLFDKISEKVVKVFTKDIPNALNNLKQVLKSFINDYLIAFLEFIINSAANVINKILSGLNWALDFADIDIPQVPTVNLPRFRSGIDYIPTDKYPAYLDKGEAVLTAQEAEQYRNAKRNSQGEVFNNNGTKSAQNIYITVNISGVTVNSDTDIDILAERLSERLADEIRRKVRAYK